MRRLLISGRASAIQNNHNVAQAQERQDDVHSVSSSSSSSSSVPSEDKERPVVENHSVKQVEPIEVDNEAQDVQESVQPSVDFDHNQILLHNEANGPIIIEADDHDIDTSSEGL